LFNVLVPLVNFSRIPARALARSENVPSVPGFRGGRENLDHPADWL
jgi:hypothetical protein